MSPEREKGSATALKLLTNGGVEWVSQGDPYDDVRFFSTRNQNRTYAMQLRIGKDSKLRILFGVGAERNRKMLKEHFTTEQDHKDIDKFFELLVILCSSPITTT